MSSLPVGVGTWKVLSTPPFLAGRMITLRRQSESAERTAAQRRDRRGSGKENANMPAHIDFGGEPRCAQYLRTGGAPEAGRSALARPGPGRGRLEPFRLRQNRQSAPTVIAGLVPAIQLSACSGVCGALGPGNKCRDDSRVSSALVSISVGNGLVRFRFTWKQKTRSPELVEGRFSPAMPCFDGAQHWVVAADGNASRVGKTLVSVAAINPAIRSVRFRAGQCRRR
jgi:hypothetical protein